MKIPCPHSVGHQTITCEDGYVRGARCPFWQSYGTMVKTAHLLDSPTIMDSELCGLIPQLQSDFAYIYHRSWKCAEWPHVYKDEIECVIIDNDGVEFTPKQVVRKYANEIAKEEEVIADDGKVQYGMFH